MAITRAHVKGGVTGASMSAAVLAATLSVIQPWEGVSLRTYKDIVGVPTRCYGETAKEVVNDPRDYTIKDCRDLLAKRAPTYWSGMMNCIDDKVRAIVPDSVQATGTSLAYNVGVGAVCKSTFVKRINAQDWEGACDALLLYRFAGGKEVRGLGNRRRAEHQICLKGLPS